MFFADRVDLPFITVDSLSSAIFVTKAAYADRKWDPFWTAWLVLQEFASLIDTTVTPPVPQWKNARPVDLTTHKITWHDGTVDKQLTVTEPTGTSTALFGNFSTTGPLTNTEVELELRFLARAARDERTDALGEIVSQSTEFLTYFMELMSINPTSHPATVRLMNIGSLIALYCCLYWKGFYTRVRPSQLMPALMPPISVPGHASFPSGHATQSWLVSLCMQQALPGFQLQTSPKLPGNPDAGSLCEAMTPGLRQLARRIARNREIAGLHYPSDSMGGRRLADQIFSQILFDGNSATALVKSYQVALAAAKAEWSASQSSL